MLAVFKFQLVFAKTRVIFLPSSHPPSLPSLFLSSVLRPAPPSLLSYFPYSFTDLLIQSLSKNFIEHLLYAESPAVPE